MTNQGTTIVLKTEEDLKLLLAKEYKNQITNFFGNDKQALKFLSAVMSAVQRNPKLLLCTAPSLINAFMTMAQLQLMPSDVSGEAFVIPYSNKGVQEAQFQLGYQGLITLFYRAGGQRLRAEIVREKDQFSYQNGEVRHTVNITKSKQERGKPIAAYAIATANDQEVALAMNAADILSYGRQFSQSYGTKFSPWDPANDPEGWMWKKTVLKQLAKLLPKNETIMLAIAEDNKESTMHDWIKAQQESDGMRMGDLALPAEAQTETAEAAIEAKVEDESTNNVPQCTNCAKVINGAEQAFSTKKYGKALCRDCQKEQKAS